MQTNKYGLCFCVPEDITVMIFNKWLISFILQHNFLDMGVKIMSSILVTGVYDI